MNTAVPAEERPTVPDEAADPSIPDPVAWFGAARARVHALSELVFAEAKLAAMSVTLMTALGLAAAICVLTAWGFAMAGLVLGLLASGASLWAALLGLAVIHLVAAALLWRTVMGLSQHVGFQESREQFLRSEGEA